MRGRIKIWFKNKWEGTIFSEASRQLGSVWSNNKYALIAEMIGVVIISAYITGFLGLALMNLFGNEYSYSIRNVFAVWSHYAIFKAVILFRTTTKRDERGFDVNQEHPYGDADFMSPEVMHKRFICEPIESNKATIFGCDPKNEKILIGQKHPQLKVNRNCFIVAGPSAGKSATFIIPLILQIMRRGESAIISDPKSELFKFCSELGKALGYDVYEMTRKDTDEKVYIPAIKDCVKEIDVDAGKILIHVIS